MSVENMIDALPWCCQVNLHFKDINKDRIQRSNGEYHKNTTWKYPKIAFIWMVNHLGFIRRRFIVRTSSRTALQTAPHVSTAQ